MTKMTTKTKDNNCNKKKPKIKKPNQNKRTK